MKSRYPHSGSGSTRGRSTSVVDRQWVVPTSLGSRIPLTSLTQTLAVAEYLNFRHADKGARLVLEALPAGATLIADRGYDRNWFREVLVEKDITPCIPLTKNRKTPIAYDKVLYRQRHKVENMFAKLKDWRRIATAMTAALTPSSQPCSAGLWSTG